MLQQIVEDSHISTPEKSHNSTMSVVTRAIAKGIPPRVRSPGKTKKKAVPKPSKKPAPKHNKRNASEGSNDESEESNHELEQNQKAGKKYTKRQHIEPDVEMVDDAEPEPLVEEVEEDDPALSSNEVSSSKPSLRLCTHTC